MGFVPMNQMCVFNFAVLKENLKDLMVFVFGLAGSETGNEYRTLSNCFSFAKTPMRAAPSPALVSSALWFTVCTSHLAQTIAKHGVSEQLNRRGNEKIPERPLTKSKQHEAKK